MGFPKILLPAVAALTALAPTRAVAAEKPNIIYILADDLGFGDVGFQGQTKIATPNIDKLAQQGMVFTQHYAGSPVCAPSRCTLLTGKHTGHAYIRGNGPFQLRPEDVSIFELLRKAGYRTALIGKSGLSGDVEDGAHPNAKGVDHFFGFVNHLLAHHYFPPKLFRNGEVVAYPKNTKHEGDNYSADLFLADALEFLETNAERPFFLHYATQLPHASLYAPEQWKAPYRGKFPEEPLTGQTHNRNEPEPKATFAGMVARLDWEVGEILATLKKLGIEQNTIVIFASDNGPTKQRGYDPAFFGSSGPFRGAKRDVTEGGLRVPMIVRWPAVIPAGSRTDHVSAFWDFLPTACELAGVSAPKDIDGISFAATLRGEPAKQEKHEFLYWEFYEEGGKRAVLMDGRWKAMQLNLNAGLDGPVALYDLSVDPHEDANVAAEKPDMVARAKELFRTQHTESENFRWGKKPQSP